MKFFQEIKRIAKQLKHTNGNTVGDICKTGPASQRYRCGSHALEDLT